MELSTVKNVTVVAVRGVIQMDNSYFVGWGTLALINAGLAQGKNRSGLNWFLLSTLLGPVATFCLVLSEKSDSFEWKSLW